MKLAVIVDYGAGNIGSISNFLSKFDFNIEVSNDLGKISEANLLVLPGVGSFGPAKSNLDSQGVSAAIVERFQLGRPILGICLGFQLMTQSSEEADGVPGLGLVHAITRRLASGPIIGWQRCLPQSKPSEIRGDFYFNHAFGVFGMSEQEDVLLSEGNNCIAYIRVGNLIGTQFHPEKSQQAGVDFFSTVISKFWQELA